MPLKAPQQVVDEILLRSPRRDSNAELLCRMETSPVEEFDDDDDDDDDGGGDSDYDSAATADDDDDDGDGDDDENDNDNGGSTAAADNDDDDDFYDDEEEEKEGWWWRWCDGYGYDSGSENMGGNLILLKCSFKFSSE